MTVGIHPFLLIAGVGLIGAVLVCVFAWRASSWFKRVLLILLALVLIVPAVLVGVALKPELADGRFRTYKQFYRDIQVGMTREQVMQLIVYHYPSDGKRSSPTVLKDTETQLYFFMNPEKRTQPNCEGIFLTMQEGKVVEKEYSPD